MEPLKIIQKYYHPNTKAYNLLIRHSTQVANKALEIAKKLKDPHIDLKFIKEAAMLHDIGIFKTYAPSLGCYGNKPYICHGYLGREILEKEGLPKHALVCERHIGVGITKEEIERKKLPLPKRDMVPISLEEKIICFADKFFSKSSPKEKSISEIKKELSKIGRDKVKKFERWLKLFTREETQGICYH
ncbi:HDIG domain-containing protein [bacterium]|nr:HDIG domain-containing protein [bacterium]